MRNIRLHGKELVFGENALDFLKELHYKKYFIVTGKAAMFNNGTIDRVKSLLDENNCEYTVFSGIGANPTTDVVLEGVREMDKFNPDAIIGVGGGSAIDASKVMVLLHEHPKLNFESIRQSIDLNISRKACLIAIPSTSGTGTEVTKTAVITFKEDNIKIGLKTYSFIPDYAILDSEITLSMPKDVVACTGLDAMTHAVECYINKKLDDFSEVLCKGAVEGLYKYLPVSYMQGDLQSRQKVHNYQAMAGSAFHNIGLGMDHGISHAFGGLFNYGHGLLNAIGLPYVLEYNSKENEVYEKLKKLSKVIGEDDFIEGIRKLNRVLNIPKSFQEMGITEEEFKSNYNVLLDNSMLGSTRSNPIVMTKEEMDKVLRSIYYGKIVF
ncbi:iron-containing alcohol dehydrogenase [Alkalibaculum sp. M08DMB]|uniref:Iron-containing alcohol dehydrogenase n=1 Tax=Alkalibaculum sporogenes TaxID=2655001 RepID=A0A6A7K697_9FIRM|nr:iron-containing alcohol dehydrogenase [Alkalibaculum sporogenes]MPW24912.1 iron-containing alcohol dehydrogenase [Alkalibaculum sporogenes]